MKRGREEREFKKKMTERGFGEPLADQAAAKKNPIRKSPTNYARPRVRPDPKSTRMATAGTRARAKKEEVKVTAQQKNAKIRRSAADRNRLAKPTQSSQRKATNKKEEKKEIRAIEHQRFDASAEPQMDPEKMYREIEQEEQEIQDKIANDPNEFSPEDNENQEDMNKYIEEPNEFEKNESPEGENYPQEYEDGDGDNEGEGNPLLFVDVNLGPGRAERIVVYEGDTAEELADEFTKKHGLDESLKDKLVKLLENQIAGLLGPVIEGEDEDTSNGTEN